MNTKFTNTYWVKLFIKEIFKSKQLEFEEKGIECCTIQNYGQTFIYHKRVHPKKKELFTNLLKTYGPFLADNIIKVNTTSEFRGEKIFLYRYLKSIIDSYDKESKLELNKIKFELINLDCSNPFGPQYYLVACTIDKLINFELVYGTLKVLNKI